MSREKTNKVRIFAVFALVFALMISALVAIVPNTSMDAAAGDSSSNPYTVNIAKGQQWVYDTTFPASLSPEVTIEYQGSSWTSTNGTYASVAGQRVTVTIPAGASVSEYNVVIKAQTSNPTQIARQYVKFVIVDTLTLTGSSTATAVVGTAFSWTPTSNASSLNGAVWSVSGTLPTGLSINTSTGVISGTPTAAKAAANYTVTVSTTNPVQSKSMTVNIVSYSKLTAGNAVTVNDVIGTANTYAAPTNAADLTVTWAVTTGTLPTGLTLNTSTGAITGSYSGSSTTYDKQVTLTATTAQGTQTAIRMVTFNYESAATITGTGTIYSVAGVANTTGLTLGSNLGAKAVWSISSYGSLSSSLVSIDPSTGKITTAAGVTAGTYTITVQVASDTVTKNTKTATVTIVVESKMAVTAPTNVYAAVGGAYDPAQLSVNIAGDVTYELTGYGGLAGGASKVTVDANGNISVAAASGDAGTYTISAKATMTSSGQTATTTFSLVIVDQLVVSSSPSAGYIVETG